MKKVLIGCGVIALLTIVLFVGCSACVAVRTVGWIRGIEASAENLQEVSRAFPFEVPADGVAQPDRFEAYLQLREGLVEQAMGVSLIAEIAAASEQDRQPNIGMGSLFRALGSVSQVMDGIADSMRAAEMGPDEFVFHSAVVLQWVQRRAAAGDQDAQQVWEQFGDIFAEVNSQLQQQTDPNLRGIATTRSEMEGAVRDAAVPEANLALVERHRERLLRNPTTLAVELLFAGFYLAGQADD